MSQPGRSKLRHTSHPLSHSRKRCRAPELWRGMWSLWEPEAGKNVIKAGWRGPGGAFPGSRLLCQLPLAPALGEAELGTIQWKSGSEYLWWPQWCQFGKEKRGTWSPWPWLNLLNREQFSLNQKKWRATQFTWPLTQHCQSVIQTIMKTNEKSGIFIPFFKLFVCLPLPPPDGNHMFALEVLNCYIPIYLFSDRFYGNGSG